MRLSQRFSQRVSQVNFELWVHSGYTRLYLYTSLLQRRNSPQLGLGLGLGFAAVLPNPNPNPNSNSGYYGCLAITEGGIWFVPRPCLRKLSLHVGLA